MYILFDIGGTKTRIARSYDGQTFEHVQKYSTPPVYEDGVRLIVETARMLAGDQSIQAIAGGVPGPLNSEHTSLVNAPNLQGWINTPLKHNLMTALQAPVTLENDTAVVALGEAQYGAGKGFPILAYITVSTGVGGARLVQGTVDQNTLGFEPGHQLFSVGDAYKPDMPLKSAENILSGIAMQQRFGKPPREITDPAVWEEYARWLAILINNTLVYWSPDALIVGGSMVVGDPAIPLESALRYLREIMTIFPNPPFIAKAQLRDEGGLYGALALIRQNPSNPIKTDPRGRVV